MLRKALRLHMRPRHNEWLPFVTQQMRLRSLMRIEGFNIIHSNNGGETLIYYTLHASKDDIAFYASEPLPMRLSHMKWAEINCEELLQSNAKCVCIKVWASTRTVPNHKSTTNADKAHLSTLSKDFSRVCQLHNNSPRPPDKLLFTWAVYFSGLMHLNLKTEQIVHFLPNTLIFLINDNYFCAPDFLMPESLRQQLAINDQRIAAFIPMSEKTIEVEEAEEETDDNYINSSQASPKQANSLQNDTHWQQNLKLKCGKRFEALKIPTSMVRPSYTVKQLLRLQELQRLRQQTAEETESVMQAIKQVSVLCISSEQLRCKPRRISNSSSPNYQQSMGRTLSVLLAEQDLQVEPQMLLHMQKLKVQLETLSARQELLQAERAAYVERNKQLKLQLAAIHDSKIQLSNWLSSQKEGLQIAQQELQSQKTVVGLQHQMHCSIMQQLEQRMCALCLELSEIYPIVAKNGFHTICNIVLPDLDAYMNDAKCASNIAADHITPMALSAALGYLAHLVQIISIIINRPLRNPIIHEGSRSRIMDVVKELPASAREFPLYCRSIIPSKAVKYGIYLLNQNIAQLCFEITGVRCDLRATIDNIKRIFATFAEYEESQRLLFDHDKLGVRSTKSGKRHVRKPTENNMIVKINCDETLSKSHSSVDINYMPIQTNTTLSVQTNALELTATDLLHEPQLPQRRVCRSVGSYSDCEDEHFTEHMEHKFSTSDFNLSSSRRAKHKSLNTFKMPE